MRKGKMSRMREILVKAVGVIISEEYQQAFDAKPEEEIPFIFAMDLLKQRLDPDEWAAIEKSSLFNLASMLTLGDIIQAAKV